MAFTLPHLAALATTATLIAAATTAAPALAGDDGPTVEAPPRIKTIAVPSPCPGPNCALGSQPVPTALGLRVVFLSFDGVTLTGSNSNDSAVSKLSAIVDVPPGQTLTISAFSPFQLGNSGGLSRDQIIARTIEDLYASHAPYNVEFVTTEPTEGNYSMVVFGGSCQSVAGRNNCGGIALLDCGDQFPANITFVFPPGLRVGDLASVAAQEAAHAFGLAHTEDVTDVMFPEVQLGRIPTRFGAGDIPLGDDNCQGGGFQDSDQLMLDTIGFRGQDTIPPNVLISSPLNGSIIRSGDAVSATVTELNSVTRVELVVGTTVVAESTVGPFVFTLPDDTDKGEVLLAVRATDDSDNTGFQRIGVYIVGGAEDIPCDDGSCPGELTCITDICVDRSEGGLGSLCTDSAECDSGVCATFEDEKRCSQACDGASPCPSGFECKGDVACWPEQSSGGICQAAGSRDGAPAVALIFVAILFGLHRRARPEVR